MRVPHRRESNADGLQKASWIIKLTPKPRERGMQVPLRRGIHAMVERKQVNNYINSKTQIAGDASSS